MTMRTTTRMATLIAMAATAAFAESTWDYVQDGLVACWDGAENAGRLNHDPNAAVWKDVIGGKEFSLTGVTVEADRMVFAGTTTSYGSLSAADSDETFNLATNGTMEIVYASATGTGSQVILHASSASHLAFGFYSATKLYLASIAGKNATFTSGVATNTVATRYLAQKPQSVIANGTVPSLSGSSYWGGTQATSTIGMRSDKSATYVFNGSIYCIRLYNRQLTDAEIAANQAVDVNRFRRGNILGANDLVISATPMAVGTPSPDYGVVGDMAAGATRNISCPAALTNQTSTIAAICRGWKLYDGEGNVVDSDTSTSLTYTHPTPAAYRRLEWQLDVTVKVSAAADEGGSASPAVQWVAVGDTAMVTATPNAGFSFFKWMNDVPASVSAYSPTISFAVSSPVSLFASFGGVYQANDAATLQTVIESHHAGDRIVLADNIYRPDYTLYLTNGVTLAGSSFTNCVIKPTGKHRVIEISGEDSRLENITITGGSVTPSADGERASGICINGGTVSHCMVSNNVLISGAKSHLGVGIYMLNGIIEDSIITANTLPQQWSHGAGIYMENGTVRRCVISGNSQPGSNSFGGGICAVGGTISHCVISGNSANYGGGLCLGKYTAGLLAPVLVDRCLIYGNTARTTGGGIASRSSSTSKWTMRHTTVAKNTCTYSSGGPGGIHFNNSGVVGFCESCIFADNTQTYDAGTAGYPNWDNNTKDATTNNLAKVMRNCLFGNGSFPLGAASISGNAAFESLANNDFHLTAISDAVDAGLVSGNVTDDLDGNAVTDGKPDIGCYEANFASAPFSCAISYAAASLFEGTSVSLSATPVNPPDGVTVRYVWTLADGGTNSVEVLGLSATATIANAGSYTVTLRAYDNDGGALLFETTGETSVRIYPRTIYAYPGDDLASIVSGLVNGQTLILDEGIFETTKTIAVNANATVVGAGIDRTIIAFTSENKLFKLQQMEARVSDLTIRGGRTSGSDPVVSVPHGVLCDVRITQCKVNGATYGYSVLNVTEDGLVERCILDHNTNTTTKGNTPWVYTRGGTALVSGKMRNCLLHHNYADTDATVAVSDGRMENCTIVDNLNVAPSIEAVAVMMKGNAVVRNTLVARNESPNWTTNVNDTGYALTGSMPVGSPPSWVQKGNTASASHNCWGESPETYGSNCADGSRISFSNPEAGDWRIRANSSCRDAGRLNADWMTEDAIDLAGNPRVFHGAVDIGCYENQGSPSTVLMLQ